MISWINFIKLNKIKFLEILGLSLGFIGALLVTFSITESMGTPEVPGVMAIVNGQKFYAVHTDICQFRLGSVLMGLGFIAQLLPLVFSFLKSSK